MSFFANLFNNTKKGKSVVLVDIGPDSVAGVYARYTEGEQPALLYTRRLPVEKHSGEPQAEAMLRALKILGETLIREGAPILARTTGSGTADSVLVSIDAPWQTTSVRTEHFEEAEPFVFTRGLVLEKLKTAALAADAATEGKMIADESIIGTILNGYETRDPYGKKAHRASIVVLTSLIDEHVAQSISSIVGGIYHTKRIQPIAGSSLRYQALQRAFPHEHDALMIDATGPFTSVALIRKGLLVSISEVEASNVGAVESWLKRVSGELTELARNYPLPRTIFLLAREPEAAKLQEALAAANLGKLWLSDDPPRIVAVLASHVTSLVRQVSSAPPDLVLLLMVLYAERATFADAL